MTYVLTKFDRKIDRLVSVIVPPHHLITQREEEIFIYVLKLPDYLGYIKDTFVFPHLSGNGKVAISVNACSVLVEYQRNGLSIIIQIVGCILARAGILHPIWQVFDNDKHAVSEVLHKFKRYLYFRVFE